MCNNNNDCSCFSRIIEKIIGLQQQGDACDDFNGCDRPFLGSVNNILCLNTRPITFYGCGGSQFLFPYILKSFNKNFCGIPRSFFYALCIFRRKLCSGSIIQLIVFIDYPPSLCVGILGASYGIFRKVFVYALPDACGKRVDTEP